MVNNLLVSILYVLFSFNVHGYRINRVAFRTIGGTTASTLIHAANRVTFGVYIRRQGRWERYE